jgi:hypothetical protein
MLRASRFESPVRSQHPFGSVIKPIQPVIPLPFGCWRSLALTSHAQWGIGRPLRAAYHFWTPSGLPRSTDQSRVRVRRPLSSAGWGVCGWKASLPSSHVPEHHRIIHISMAVPNEGSIKDSSSSPYRTFPRPRWPVVDRAAIRLLPAASHPSVARDACAGGKMSNTNNPCRLIGSKNSKSATSCRTKPWQESNLRRDA